MIFLKFSNSFSTLTVQVWFCRFIWRYTDGLCLHCMVKIGILFTCKLWSESTCEVWKGKGKYHEKYVDNIVVIKLSFLTKYSTIDRESMFLGWNYIYVLKISWREFLIAKWGQKQSKGYHPLSIWLIHHHNFDEIPYVCPSLQ